MKNCLVVLVLLLVCLGITVWLVLFPPWGGSGLMTINGAEARYGALVAIWRDEDDPDLRGLQAAIATNQITIEMPSKSASHRWTEQGHWNLHAFFCDSHVDSPPEVEVAHELENEDLVLDVGRFLPSHPGKITLVKMQRGSRDQRPGYPVGAPGKSVSYPPPKGLITIGMLECDLKGLPWQADEINVTSDPVLVNTSKLSDGTLNKGYFPVDADDSPIPDESPQVYSYHSDRPDAPKLLVTVYHGRVTEVVGGAEETADIPYQLPAPAPPADETTPAPERSWAGWVFDLFFSK